MNKTVKIISTLLIAVLLVATLGQTCFASYGTIIDTLDDNADKSGVNTTTITNKAADILKVIRNLAAVLAVIVLTILGVKYMMGSTQERAEYKKSFIPLIVGIVVVVMASSIATFVFNFAG